MNFKVNTDYMFYHDNVNTDYPYEEFKYIGELYISSKMRPIFVFNFRHYVYYINAKELYEVNGDNIFTGVELYNERKTWELNDIILSNTGYHFHFSHLGEGGDVYVFRDGRTSYTSGADSAVRIIGGKKVGSPV